LTVPANGTATGVAVKDDVLMVTGPAMMFAAVAPGPTALVR
jgi:hypothetical protein